MKSNKPIWIVGLTTLIANFQLMTINTYIVIFLQEDLLTEILIITIIVSLRNFLQLFLRVPLGELSQIIGRKPLISAGHFSYTIALVLLIIASLTEDWIFALFAIILVAVGMSCFWPALFGYVADFTPNKMGESNGRIFQMGDAGVILGSFLAAVILDQLFLGLREVFTTIATIGFLAGLFNVFILPEGLPKSKRKQVNSVPNAIFNSFFSMLRSLRKITFTNHLSEVYTFQLILAFLEFGSAAFIPVIIVAKGFSKGDVSEISLWAMLIIIWFKPSLGRVADRFDFRITITISLVLSAILIFLFVLMDLGWILILLYLINNAAIITAYTTSSAEVSRRAPFDERGMALGALGFYISLGRTTSTIILGPIWEFLGLSWVFYCTSISVILVSLFSFFYFKRKWDMSELAKTSF
jgi:MFS family permease